MLPPHLARLPPPPEDALRTSAALETRIRAEIDASHGWISFARFMELALYAPGLGYYMAGSTKLGAAGDFVTAPETSGLFARCLARQIAQLLERGARDVVELGAGSGVLACGILAALAALGRLPERYLILEPSAELRDRQRERIARELPSAAGRVVTWLEGLPARSRVVVVANEVLDALPAHVVRTRKGSVEEMGVTLSDKTFSRAYRPATGALLKAARALSLADGYETEINLAARALVRTLAERVELGALLFIDYGFTAKEYYAPHRSSGTLMCHYRHRAHGDVFALVGLQDITSHVDFTAVAEVGLEAGHRVLGYTEQAQFLVNCGIAEMLSEISADDVRAYAPLASQTLKLISPAEMGERFKVIALARGIDGPLIGFSRGDRTHTL